jgi:hypothetical protein
MQMRTQLRITLQLVAPLILAACIEQAYQAGVGLAPTDTGTSAPFTSEPGTPTTSSAGSGSVQTVTGAESTSPGGEGSSPVDETSPGANLDLPMNDPPVIESFTADPPHMSEAGTSWLKLKASDDVVLVRLRLNGQQIFEGPPAKFPYAYDVLSAKYNFAHSFEVEVEDAEGLMDTAPTEITIQLPAPGAEKCLFPDVGAQTSVISGLAYTSKAIYAVGARDIGAGLKLTVWALDPDHCGTVLPGWPRDLSNWSGDPDLAKLQSAGAAITIDQSGNIGVGGNLIVNGKTQPYVALLTPDGARLWQNEGAVGEQLAGLAAFTDQFSNRLVGVGWRRTSDNPVRTDAMAWVYSAIDGNVFVSSSALKAPFTPDEQPDDFNLRKASGRVPSWLRAVVAFIVGERELRRTTTFNIYHADILGEVASNRTSVEPLWSSWGVHSVNDAARSITSCGTRASSPEGGIATSPPTRNLNHSSCGSTPTAPCPTTALKPSPGHRSTAIACDREHKILSAGTRSTGDGDAQVFAVEGLIDQRIWYEQGVAGTDNAEAVACDLRGFCAVAGLRSADGKAYAVVRVHHP